MLMVLAAFCVLPMAGYAEDGGGSDDDGNDNGGVDTSNAGQGAGGNVSLSSGCTNGNPNDYCTLTIGPPNGSPPSGNDPIILDTSVLDGMGVTVPQPGSPNIDIHIDFFQSPRGPEKCAANYGPGYSYAGSFACGAGGTGVSHVCTPGTGSTAAAQTTACEFSDPTQVTDLAPLPTPPPAANQAPTPPPGHALTPPADGQQWYPTEQPTPEWYWTGWQWTPPGSIGAITPWAPGATLVNLTVDPGNIVSGNSSNITWVSQNATSCTGNGFNAGGATSRATPLSTGALNASRTYSITCTGPGGTGIDTQTVNVSATLQPDLTPANLTGTPIAGTLTVILGATIRNIGAGATGN